MGIKVVDADYISQTVEGLQKGVLYHFRVSAWNGVSSAYGQTMYSTPAVIAPVGIQKSPSNIHIRQLNNSFVDLSTVRYRVELIAVVTNEVQIISVSSK